MKRILIVVLIAAFAITGRQAVGGDSDDPTAKGKKAQSDRAALFETAADAIGQLRRNLDGRVPATAADQEKLLRLAADLVELAGQDKDAMHLRDEAEKDHAPLGAAELIGRRQGQLDALQRQLEGLRRLTRNEQQILVYVKLIEFSPAKLRAAGVDVPFAQIAVIDDGQALVTKLEALRGKRLVKVLAEPSVITVSGRPASFNSGGEIPYLRREGQDQPTVEYKQFGTQVDLLPSATGDDRIHLDVHVKFSTVDAERSVSIGGASVPGIQMQEIKTAVECKSGQACMIGRHATSKGIDQSSNSAHDKSAADVNPKDDPAEQTELAMLVLPSFSTPTDAEKAAAKVERGGYYGNSRSVELPAPSRK